MEELHKISEWEDKIPFTVELRGVWLEKGSFVDKAVARVKDNGEWLQYDKQGYAYKLYDKKTDKTLKGDNVEIDITDHHDIYRIKSEIFDIKWE